MALLVLGSAHLAPATAWADPDPQPDPTPVAPTEQEMHNVTYRARVDGVARGALITYKINDTQVQSADPTMLPGRMVRRIAARYASIRTRSAIMEP